MLAPSFTLPVKLTPQIGMFVEVRITQLDVGPLNCGGQARQGLMRARRRVRSGPAVLTRIGLNGTAGGGRCRRA